MNLTSRKSKEREKRENGKEKKECEEVKNNSKKITENWHLRKTGAQYLFQLEDNSSNLYIFCIPKKKIKKH